MQHEEYPSARERNNQRGDGRRKKTCKKSGFHDAQRRSSGDGRGFMRPVAWSAWLGIVITPEAKSAVGLQALNLADDECTSSQVRQWQVQPKMVQGRRPGQRTELKWLSLLLHLGLNHPSQ